MSYKELDFEKSLYEMFKIDKKTKKEIIKLNGINNVFQYFNNLFNILHKDIINESKNRYSEYIIEHTELKDKLKELIKNKNNYTYKWYIDMFNDIYKKIEEHEKAHYGPCDLLFKRIGKAKFLLDEQCCDNEKLIIKLNKIKKYIERYYY
jgi:hypothetical protein